MDSHQQVTIKLYHHYIGQYIMCTFVYAKCSSLERLELWDNLYCLASDMEFPWMVGGDFNMLLHEDEKIGGRPVHPPEYEDFDFFVNSSGLFDLGYKGIEHLIRTGSDHAPLLMSCVELMSNYIKPFKFLNFWTKHENFKEVVRQNWFADFLSDPLLTFKQKLKRVKDAFSKWSKDIYGYIFKQLEIRYSV
ncbi:uncharacterized protein [Nicotiana tomentosiformis]|uniref:uncharacterized protein n=1 Tax=Nicotiana tomentosiformis TaxID=4098 RepID=UPI00388C90D7